MFDRSDKITVSLKMEPDSIFDEFLAHTNPMCSTGINCSFDQSDPKCDISAIEPSQKKSRISEFLLQTVTLSEKKYPFFHILLALLNVAIFEDFSTRTKRLNNKKLPYRVHRARVNLTLNLILST